MQKSKPHAALRALQVTTALATVIVAFQNCAPFSATQLAGMESLSSTGGVVQNAGSSGWHTLKIGAGGWLTGMDIASDGTKVVRADTYGAFVWSNNSNQWQQLVTASSMPSDEITSGAHGGVYEIKIAPSNTQRFYMAHDGNVYRSDNRGTTWQRTSFANVAMNANGTYRMSGQKIAIDPINPDVVYIGTDENGLFVSTNGGASFSAVSAVPAAQQKSGNDFGITGLAFDASSGQTGGKTNRIYATSYGNGIYTSANAGASWAATSGGPRSATSAVVSASGVYYVASADGETENLWSYSAGTWTNLQTSGGTYHSLALDYARPGRLVAANDGGVINESLDGGVTWTTNWWPAYNPAVIGIRVATDMPALAVTGGTWLSNGAMMFDPTSSLLFFSEGTGVWHTSLPDALSGFTWTSQSAGIEQLVSNKIIAPPGGNPLVASWDRPVHRVADFAKYPETYGPDASFSAGWSLDWASTSPSFIVGLINWGGSDKSGYSTDGGVTWTQFATKPAPLSAGVQGGCIAASTPQNIVISPANNTIPWYTKDGGASWAQVSIPGQSGTDGYSWAYYFKREIVAADRVTAGTFYLYNYNLGLFKTTDGGTTWALARGGQIGDSTSYNAKLKTVPGKAGNLFFTAGQIDAQTHPASDLFYRSSDGGATFSAVPNVAEVYDFAFGAPAPGSSYPAIFVAGYVNNVWGIFRSDDNASSWVNLGATPNGNLDRVQVLEADKDVHGRVYVGFSGSGYAYYNP